MSKPFNPLRATLINIISLPVLTGLGCIVGIAIGSVLLMFDQGSSSTDGWEAIGEGIIVLMVACFFIIIGFLVWFFRTLTIIQKYSEHRKFFWGNLAILLSPFLIVTIIVVKTKLEKNRVLSRQQADTIPVHVTNRMLFEDYEQILAYHQSADTIYLLTGATVFDSTKEYTVMHKGEPWKGDIYVKRASDDQDSRAVENRAILGSLKCYAFYNDSLYGGYDIERVIDSQYVREEIRAATSNWRPGKPDSLIYLTMQAITKPSAFGCRDVFINYENDYPSMYVKDTCTGKADIRYGIMPGYSIYNLGRQPWRQFGTAPDEDIFCQALKVKIKPEDEHKQDFIHIAHFTPDGKTRIYELHRSIEALRTINNYHHINNSTWTGIFKMNNKLYIIGQQNLLYFEIPR